MYGRSRKDCIKDTKGIQMKQPEFDMMLQVLGDIEALLRSVLKIIADYRLHIVYKRNKEE